MTNTTESTESRPGVGIGRIGKHWGWMLAIGFLTIAAGICALVWARITPLGAAIVFGVQLIVAGIYRLVAAFANDVIKLWAVSSKREASGRGWLVAMGIVSIVAWVLLLAIPGLSLVAMVFLIGAWLIFFGVLQHGTGDLAPLCQAHGSQPGRDARSQVTTPWVPRGAI